MICPKCGEVNSSNFLFCGMCGTILEPARRATAAVPPPPPPSAPRAPEIVPRAVAPVVTPPPAAPPVAPKPPARETTPSLGGPSLLGLDQPSSVDDLRDRAFSGLASYGRPEEPKSAGKEILLTVVLVAALAGAGWWTYNNYIGISGTHKAAVTAPTADGVNSPPAVDPAADNPVPMQAEKNNPKDAPAGAERSSADTTPAPAPKAAESAAAPESKDTKPATEPDAENSPKPATPVPTPARHEVSATRIPASQAAADPSDALFRRGESYLYGRNGTEDCGNALKYLKMAADQQHAKARSMMGTMYATGHCVPRDLPSSYRWFALALRVDPNNSILEKDLSAVWNQMTPPERQLATKSQ